MEAMVRAAGLIKIFHGQRLLRDVTLDMKKGMITGLLDPYGAEKQHLSSYITGITQLDAEMRLVKDFNPATDGNAIPRVAGIVAESAVCIIH